MYTNIDPTEGITTLTSYQHTYSNEIKHDININVILDLIDLVMRNGIFKFGDTWWSQEIGTAMGTPCACIYATLFFAYFERTYLLKKYKNNLLFYGRQIDDILGVWIDIPEHPNAWEHFQYDLNNQCKLSWETTALQSSVNFLDLTITLDNGKITTSTYQKPHNLFLYPTSNSAHPSGITKSLVYGLLSTYHKQNSNQSDFLRMTKLLLQRLLRRGHKLPTLETIFQNAISKIEHDANNPFSNVQTTPQTQPHTDRLFFHLPYHPRDISRQKIRNIYEDECAPTLQCLHNDETDGNMRITNFTIAYSRPTNLRDILCPSTLVETDEINVSKTTTSI